jgi:G3E family GTPase
MIPVWVLTGFLGSGKTTLLARLLKHPRLQRTAVIINEFGAVGLDHDLVESGEESFVTLQTGCLCCTLRGDLVATLADILRRRDQGSVLQFERVVIETSGLADPAPILHALMLDAGLSRRLTLAGVVTTVDAVNGLHTLQSYPESAKQVALADCLILTKTDLLEGQPARLHSHLMAANPAARRLTASFGDVDPDALFERQPPGATARSRDRDAWHALADHSEHARAMADTHRHAEQISCFTLLRAQPMQAITLTLLLEILADHCGADLLRLKGIVNVAESPDRPAVIHGVQHVFHPVAWLDRWPSEDRRSRLVFIVRDIPQAWIDALIAALETEVGEVMGQCSAAPPDLYPRPLSRLG